MQLRNKGDAYMQQVDRIRMIDDRRQKQGLSYRQLADMAGVSYTTVYRAISGRCCPEAATLEMLESALGIVDGVDVIHAPPEQDFPPMAERYIRAQENRIARLRYHYNMLFRTYARWMLVLFAANMGLVLLICGVTAYDLAHKDRGWFRD